MTTAQVTLRDLLFRRCHNHGKRAWQHEIAAEAGMHQSVFSRFIGGKYPVGSGQVEAIQSALRCTAQELAVAMGAVSSGYVIYKDTHSATRVRASTTVRASNGRNAKRACRARAKARK